MTIRSRIRLLVLVVSSCFVVSACESSVLPEQPRQSIAQVGSVGAPYIASVASDNGGTAELQEGENLPKLSSSSDFSRASILTSRILSTFEYNKQPLDETMAGRIFDAYFDALDSQRMFLLLSDIESFHPYRLDTAKMIAHGELDMAAF